MKNAIYLLFHLLTTLAKLIRPSGDRAVIAENLLLKQQLIIHSRSHQRAPNLITEDRTLLGFFSLFSNPRRIARSAILIRPSTLLSFHNAVKRRKYQLLYSPRGGKKRGPTLCRLFNDAISGQGWPQRISNDNDPLFQYNRWKANLRVLEIEEVKSLPYVPMSHPFVERLIGSIRWELLDQTLIWTATDLRGKLHSYQHYYNESRTHSGRNGATPIQPSGNNVADISDFQWNKHCRGLFQLPVAA